MGKKKQNNLPNIIVLPIAFLLAGYLSIYLVLSPFMPTLTSIYNLAFSDNGRSDPLPDEIVSIFTEDTGLNGGTMKASEVTIPNYGEHFANLTVEGTVINTPVIYGDQDSFLKRGACVSLYGGLFGFGRVIMISAHNNTHFNDLQRSAQIGALVHVETNYGNYVYRIFDKKIASRDDETAYKPYFAEDAPETLILYSCQLENGVSLSKFRCYCYCEFVSGPVIDPYN